MGQAEGSHVFFKDRGHLGQVEAATGQVAVGQGDLDRGATLGRSDINEALVPAPGEFLSNGKTEVRGSSAAAGGGVAAKEVPHQHPEPRPVVLQRLQFLR